MGADVEKTTQDFVSFSCNSYRFKNRKAENISQIQLQTRILLETKRSPCVGNCKNLHS